MDRAENATRLTLLRAELARAGLSAFIVPRADEHQHTYLPPHAERLVWVSGFTGSAGVAIVTEDRAALFVDGRYTIQAKEQAPGWEQQHLVEAPPDAWLAANLQAGQVVGFDPKLHTPANVRTLKAAVARAGAQLVAVATNPIDTLWLDRPAPPAGLAEVYPEAFAGESAASKRARVLEQLAKDKLTALVVSSPDGVAWLFNLRGSDLPNTPIVLCFAIVTAEGATIYADPAKMVDVRGKIAADLREPAEFEAGLRALARQRVRVDVVSGSQWIVDTLESVGATVDVGADPCLPLRAVKNARELEGIRAAHVRDGVAIVRFMKWFAETAPGGLDEWGVARVVERFRAEGANFRGMSFNTISAFAPNSALAHYSVSEASSLPLHTDAIWLLDSGVQYLDGTTDVTRTFVIGTPTPEMKRRYTQVLKGHLALGNARFPEGTTGIQLDILARQFLWADGVDFDHGTGHGVGCFLSVHEGPHGIAKRPNVAPFKPGMIVSNEPGYYKEGAFGIRIENLIETVVVDPQPAGAERTTLGFSPLTLAPYERRLIDVSLLTDAERASVDAYHARVRDTLSGLLEPAVAGWLAEQTAPLA